MSEIIATEGRGINTQARGLDHQIIAQLLIPAKARRRQLLVPMVTSAGENQRINFYSLISAFLPNPQSRTPARRAQTTWVMAIWTMAGLPMLAPIGIRATQCVTATTK